MPSLRINPVCAPESQLIIKLCLIGSQGLNNLLYWQEEADARAENLLQGREEELTSRLEQLQQAKTRELTPYESKVGVV